MAKGKRINNEIERGKAFEIEVDGKTVLAYEGETIAAALMAAGKRMFRTTPARGAPRGLYCGIGLCFDCMMVVDGRPNTRVCQTQVTPNCKVTTQLGLHNWGDER